MQTLAQAGVAIFLIKLHPDGLTFAMRPDNAGNCALVLSETGVTHRMLRDLGLVSTYAGAMRDLSGVIARIYRTLSDADVRVLQTGDAYNAVHCLVPGDQADLAAVALREEFNFGIAGAGAGGHGMNVRVLKFGGTSVDSEEHRQKACDKIIRAAQSGASVVVVVSAIGRAGAPYATDTLVTTLKQIDPAVPPATRELDMMMACGEIISTVVLAQTLRTRGYDSIALTGQQAGIVTDYEFGNARILSIDPAYVVRMLEQGKIVLVAGFQGATSFGAVTTLGRGGSDTTASALGAALKPFATEICAEIYTDVDGIKTADPRLVPDARTLLNAPYEVVAEMAHQGAKVLHPRAAELAHQYGIPLWVKSTFSDAEGTQIVGWDKADEADEAQELHVTGITHTGRIVYLRFELPSQREDDRLLIELEIYRLLQSEGISIYLTSTGGSAFMFAVARENLSRLREVLEGLVIPIDLGGRKRVFLGRLYLLGLGQRQSNFQAQRELLAKVETFVEVHAIQATVTENCTMVSVIASRFTKIPGIMAKILTVMAGEGIPVYQTADSAHSISVLIPEGDTQKATRLLHDVFGLGKAAGDG